MSVTVWVAREKIALPLPTSFRTFVNVRSMLAPDCTCSSSMPVLLLIAVDSRDTAAAVTFAAPPVDLIT
jgi:hypothetical protein